MKDETTEAIEVAKKTKSQHKMQHNNKFITLDMAFALGWISKRTGEVTKKYLKDQELKTQRKEKAKARAEKAKQAKVLAKAKAKEKAEKKKEREAQAKADAKAKAQAKKEREKVRAEKIKAEAKAKADRKKQREQDREAKRIKAQEDSDRIKAEKAEAKAKKIAEAKANAEAKAKKLKQFQEEAKKVGLPVPKRMPRKIREAGEIEANDGTIIKSPYDMDRRSGYKIIWQVLAEQHDEVMSNEALHAEVNKRLAEDPESADWYREKYSGLLDDLGRPKEYPVVKNAADVMTRPPYNGVKKTANGEYIVTPISLEGLNQRIVAGATGVMLQTNVKVSYAELRLQKEASA